jgi:putative endopeptidase
MSADTVNAYYNPSSNSINFPAAILQPPFYDFNAPRPYNYGGIGAVIAHEITHAFDSNGSHFDENGNLHDWWTEEDFKNFDARNQKVIDLYDGIEIVDGVKSNGKLTISENIADLGGMTAALVAAKTENDWNPEQFFTSWEIIWRNKSRDEYAKLLANIDVHSAAKIRGNVTPQNFPEFYETFDIQKGDGMWLDEDKRVQIW